MIKEDLDFLNALPLKSKNCSAIWIELASLALIALLSLISLIGVFYQINYFFTLKKLRYQNTLAQEQFISLAKKYPLLNDKTPLQDLLHQKEMEWQRINQSFEKTKSNGFSPYLAMLADLVPRELWLEKISINQTESMFSLHGFSLKAEKVSLFAQRLQNAPLLKNRVFKIFSIQEEPETNHLSFQISNTHPIPRKT